MATFITEEHKKELEKELETLQSDLAGRIADKLSESTTKDQAEDATYAEAMQERDIVKERIAKIEELLEDAEIIDSSVCNTEYVTLGALVKIKLAGAEKEIRIVGASESSPTDGKISYESPLGQALIGAKKGEIVSLLRPDGSDQEVEVIDIKCE